ncbi:MAG: fumarylacetoacetate hydrolase family protein [Methyloligellaceae bacterium]
MGTLNLQTSEVLPKDIQNAKLIGRIWAPELGGPSVVTIRENDVIDITTSQFSTVRDYCELSNPVEVIDDTEGKVICSVDQLIKNSSEEDRNIKLPWLISPVDLQAIKASGVTFVVSLLERVIEEQAMGDSKKAFSIREDIQDIIGSDLSMIKPGSDEAAKLKEELTSRGVWSQYLEVGIGPDAEIFTKAQVLSTVGCGANIGVHPDSGWNNPEPEVVIIANSSGTIVGSSLGNDVNLRDIEGRSALLLGKAKDNNASAAIGPFIRLFDSEFSLEDVKRLRIGVEVQGEDGFSLIDHSSMSEISRTPESLVSATCSEHHQYPDGFALYLGTMFAPTKDRGAPGKGFTHVSGDIVTIHNDRLGKLINTVRPTSQCNPWVFGTRALITNLAGRGLL